jgi:2-polyprenyl-3-methyl-5-hydroxy-6-metoxy-1,4-benzoquinol methylase
MTGTAAFACVACDSTKSVPRFTGCRDLYLGHPMVVDYVRCTTCGLVQQHPVPADLGALYVDYPIHVAKPGLHEWFRRIVLKGVYFAPGSLPVGSRLLDFGCGDGWFLGSMKNRTGLICEGYEFQPGHAQRLSAHLNLLVFSETDRLARERTGGYQAITLHYVLEHVASPLSTLATLERLLAPGGLLYIVVPNVDSWEGRLFARRWHGLDPPRHVSFPTPSVMQALANDAGLLLEARRYVAFAPTSAASIVSVVAGRYRHALFLAAMPAGVILSRLAPSGSLSYVLRKPGPEPHAVRPPSAVHRADG